MDERSGEKDTRGTVPPADERPEAKQSEGPAATEEAGPQGNPAVDEEGLANRQQEQEGGD